jgi:hypothetical protein
MAQQPDAAEDRRFGLARPFDTLAFSWLGIAAVLLCGVVFGLGLQNGGTEALGVLAAIVFVVGALGARWLFGGYTLSLDEFLADFDARIFASGRLFAPIPPAWRDFSSALQPMYILPLPDDVWASEYLPVNAAIRALASKAGAEDLVNPLLVGRVIADPVGVAAVMSLTAGAGLWAAAAASIRNGPSTLLPEGADL